MNQGLLKYFFDVVDEFGRPYTGVKKVSILGAGTDTAATVYSDTAKTAKTNPIVDSESNPIEFFYHGQTVDVMVETQTGKAKMESVTPGTNRIKINKSRTGMTLLYANDAAGALLVDDAGVFVDFPHTYTIEGANIEVGDVFRIMGTVLFIDLNAADTMDLKVLFGSEAILQTTDQTPAADEDTITFDLEVTVEKVGATGRLKVVGHWETDLNGTVLNYIVSPTGGAKYVEEDISGDIVVKCQGDYSAEHADNEAYLIDFKIFEYKPAYRD